MPRLERVRDFMVAPPSAEYFAKKSSEGFELVAIEWQRRGAAGPTLVEDVPFGVRVSSDCRRLEEDPDEIQMMLLVLEVIVTDGPLSKVAQVDPGSVTSVLGTSCL